MLFNVLCGNRDDHLKNHALLYAEDGWRLAPAFDVVPQPGILERVQAIAVGVLGGIPTIANCLSRCGEFRRSPSEWSSACAAGAMIFASLECRHPAWSASLACSRRSWRSRYPFVGARHCLALFSAFGATHMWATHASPLRTVTAPAAPARVRLASQLALPWVRLAKTPPIADPTTHGRTIQRSL
jgi:hypothetical protein